MRSISIGTQPMPPSENATRISGKRVGIRAHSQSAAAAIALTENSDVYSSSGAPGERAAVHDDDPLCRQIDGLRLLARAQERIPVVGVHRRQAEVDGVLGEAHGLEAALGVAAHVGRRDLRDRAATRAGAG